MAKKIEIVEDDPFLKEMMSKKLTAAKYTVVPAADGKEGIKKAKEEQPDLILLDLILPGIDGYQVLEKLKADKETSKIPVVIISNLGQKEEVDKGLDLGAADFLVKAHFTPDDIIDKVKEVLKK